MSFREAKWLLEQIKSSLNNNSSGFQQVIKEQIELLNLPYEFYRGSAVVYNNEIHIIGGNGTYTKHYKYNGSSWTSVSTLPYNFYSGSAVVYNNEIHILGGGNGQTKHYKYNGSSWDNYISYILNKISIPKDMIIQCSSYDTSKTNSSTLQSLGSNKYKALSDTIVYTKEDKVNITNHQ